MAQKHQKLPFCALVFTDKSKNISNTKRLCNQKRLTAMTFSTRDFISQKKTNGNWLVFFISFRYVAYAISSGLPKVTLSCATLRHNCTFDIKLLVRFDIQLLLHFSWNYLRSSALIRRTPLLLDCSLVITNVPRSPVFWACGPPQISLLKSPMEYTFTTSP